MIDNRLLKYKNYCHFIMAIPKSQSVIVGGQRKWEKQKEEYHSQKRR